MLEGHYPLFWEQYTNATWYKICTILQNISVSHLTNVSASPNNYNYKRQWGEGRNEHGIQLYYSKYLNGLHCLEIIYDIIYILLDEDLLVD